jgi:hypothetical protein
VWKVLAADEEPQNGLQISCVSSKRIIFQSSATKSKRKEIINNSFFF